MLKTLSIVLLSCLVTISSIYAQESFPEDHELRGKYKLLILKDKPQLKRIFTLLSKKLFEAKNQLIEQDNGEGANTFRHYIVDSDELNAFIYQDAKVLKAGGWFSSAVTEPRDNIVITRGLLQSFLAQSQNEQEFITYLSGVIAHEFAHTFEGRGVIPSGNWFQRAYNSQNLEVLTDARGIDILVKAQLPENAVYLALKSLFEASKQISETGVQSTVDKKILNAQKSIDQLISTHPEQNVRKSFQRFLLTLRRYSHGLIDPVALKSLSNKRYLKIRKELNILPAKSLIPTTRIKTISEAWTRFENLKEIKDEVTFLEYSREYTYNIYWITQYYGSRVQQMSLKQKEKFRKLITKSLLYKGYQTPLDLEANQTKISSDDSQKQKNFKLESADFFQEEFGKNFFELAKENSLLSNDGFLLELFLQVSTSSRGKNRVQEIISKTDFASYIEKPIENIFQLILDSEDTHLYIQGLLNGEIERRVFKNKAYSFIRKVFFLYAEVDKLENVLDFVPRYLANITLERQLDFLNQLAPYLSHNDHLRQKFLYSSMMLEIKKTKEIDHYLIASQYRVKSESSIRGQKNIYQKFRKIMDNPNFKESQWLDLIWHNRAEIALLEAIRGESPYRTDWGIVFGYKNMEFQPGFENLRDSIKKFCKTKKYPHLIKNLELKPVDYVKWADARKFNRLPWARSDLWEYMSGYQNSNLSNEMRDRLKSIFSRGLFFSNPELRNKLVFNEMIQALNSRESEASLFDFNVEDLKISQKVYGLNVVNNAKIRVKLNPLQDGFGETIERETKKQLYNKQLDTYDFKLEYLWAKAISRSSLNQKVKTSLLKRLLFQERKGWFEQAYARKIKDLLLSLKVIESSSDLFEKMGRYSVSTSEITPNLSRSLSIPNNIIYKRFFNDFMREISIINKSKEDSATKYSKYMLLHKRVLRPVQSDKKAHPNIRKIADSLFSGILNLDIEELKVEDAFLQIYKHNPTDFSDIYFQEKLVSKFFDASFLKKTNSGYWKTYSDWPEYISKKYIRNREILLSTLELYLDQLIIKKDHKDLHKEAFNILTEFNNAYPHSSLRKDSILEKIVWDLNLTDIKLLKKIENLKSSKSLSKMSPGNVNVFSGVSQYVETMEASEILTLIKFIKSEKKKLSAEVKSLFKKSLKKDVNKSSSVWKQIRKGASFESAFEQLVFYIEGILSGANTKERMPLYEILLNKGAQPIMERSDYIDIVLQEIAGMSSLDQNYNYIKAYVSSALEYERSVILSYIISQGSMQGNDPSAIKDIFEQHGVVGKKTGQWISLLNIMDERYADSLAELKSRSVALSRYQIYERLSELLDKDEFNKISNVESIIGSASTKTVVKLKLKNGKYAVASIQPPNSLVQTRTQITFFEKFISELTRSKTYEISAFQRELFSVFTKNILSELDFKIEEKNIKIFNNILGKIKSKHSFAGDWDIQSVKVSTELTSQKEVLFTDLIEGSPFSDIAKGEQLSAAEELVSDILNKLFLEYGYVEADRHRGNQLLNINQGSKTITFLDIAQLKKFRTGFFFTPDTRTRVVGLMRNFELKNASNYYHFLNAISSGKRIQSEVKDKIINEIDLVFQDKLSESESIIKTFEIFYEYGGKIQESFLTYFFKSFLTINAESYVSASTMKAQITNALDLLLNKKKAYFYFNKSKFETCNKILLN